MGRYIAYEVLLLQSGLPQDLRDKEVVSLVVATGPSMQLSWVSLKPANDFLKWIDGVPSFGFHERESVRSCYVFSNNILVSPGGLPLPGKGLLPSPITMGSGPVGPEASLGGINMWEAHYSLTPAVQPNWNEILEPF